MANSSTFSSSSTISKYLSLVKFSHTVFALPFAMIGFSLAIIYEQQTFKWYLFFLVLLCMVFARSAAMAFNRFLDRKFDALNPRTAIREIPSGVIKPQNALYFTIANCVLFVITCLFINPICLYLSPVALFVILFYSYTKRFTPLCHLVLGIGLGLAPIGAYLAVTGYFHILPILYSIAVFCWVAGFDIIYALQDEQFDKEHQLLSIPAAFGRKKALIISNILHILTAITIITAGIYGQFNYLYWIGTLIFTGLLLYQHLIVSPKDISKVNIAFANTNGLASISFAIFVILDMVIL